MIYSICTQYRNEANKLKPWILYHKEQGFNTFILYDDNSSDESIKICNNIAVNHNVNIILNQSDSKTETTYSSSLQTEEYQKDVSLNKRIARSFLNGFEIFKNLSLNSNNSFCAFIDVDECLTTDSTNNIVDVINNLFDIQKTNHLYAQSFDVDTSDLTTDIGVFLKEQTTYRWSSFEKETFMEGKFKYRGKSIVTNSYDFPFKTDIHCWSIVHCAGAIGNNFETAIPPNSNKNCNIEDLRIHHYRVPPNDGCRLFSQKDLNVYNNFKKVYDKYEI